MNGDFPWTREGGLRGALEDTRKALEEADDLRRACQEWRIRAEAAEKLVKKYRVEIGLMLRRLDAIHKCEADK